LKPLLRKLPRPGLWAFIVVGLSAFLFLLWMHARIYSPEYGITKLIRIGQEFDNRGLAAFRAAPKLVGADGRWGFDGQHYAQLALDPLLRDPQLKTALDNPPLRSRRILMSWLAWLGGFGRPAWVLNVYSALNLVFWVGFAILLAVLFRPLGWAGVAGFSALLLTCGIVESMGSALTDFPGYVLITYAMVVGGAGGAMLIALSALTREPNIIAVLGLLSYRPPWLPALKRNLLLVIIATVPLLAWCLYVIGRFPPNGEIDGGNMSWPLHGILWKLDQVRMLFARGSLDLGHLFIGFYYKEPIHALLTIVSVLTQSVYLLTHREWDNRIWRAGVVFIPFFLCIGIPAWESHFTVTRHALPITIAFNLILAMRPRRSWLLWFVLGNCFVPYGVHLYLKFYSSAHIPVPAELKIGPDVPQHQRCTVRFDEGWSGLEWTSSHSWRWAVAQQTSLSLTNPTDSTMEGSLVFETRSIKTQKLEIRVRGLSVASSDLGDYMKTLRTSRFQLPPGDTIVTMETDRIPLPYSGGNGDTRCLSFSVQDIRFDPATPAPANPAGTTGTANPPAQ